MDLLHIAADGGLDESRYMLAVLKYEGSGIDMDKAGAFVLFKDLAVNFIRIPLLQLNQHNLPHVQGK